MIKLYLASLNVENGKVTRDSRLQFEQGCLDGFKSLEIGTGWLLGGLSMTLEQIAIVLHNVCNIIDFVVEGQHIVRIVLQSCTFLDELGNVAFCI